MGNGSGVHEQVGEDLVPLDLDGTLPDARYRVGKLGKLYTINWCQPEEEQPSELLDDPCIALGVPLSRREL